MKRYANKRYCMRICAIWIHPVWGLPLFIPVDMTPPVSCHFFCSIKHLIPKVSEALQSSWGASLLSCFFVPCGPDAQRKEVVRFFLATKFFPRDVCPFRNYRVFFWSDDWAVCCDGQQRTKALKRSTICGKNESPIFLSNSTTFAELTAYHFSTNLFHIWRVRILFCTKDPRDTGLWSIDS